MHKYGLQVGLIISGVQAAAAVAPPGFKLHYDFNHGRTLASCLSLLRELQEEHPIVGFIEDPVKYEDLEAWCAIRRQFSIPIVMVRFSFWRLFLRPLTKVSYPFRIN